MKMISFNCRCQLGLSGVLCYDELKRVNRGSVFIGGKSFGFISSDETYVIEKGLDMGGVRSFALLVERSRDFKDAVSVLISYSSKEESADVTDESAFSSGQYLQRQVMIIMRDSDATMFLAYVLQASIKNLQ